MKFLIAFPLTLQNPIYSSCHNLIVAGEAATSFDTSSARPLLTLESLSNNSAVVGEFHTHGEASVASGIAETRYRDGAR